MQLRRWRFGFDMLVDRASVAQTIAASVVLLICYLSYGVASRHLDEPWKIDEGQRIAEGYFWRLLRSGDVSHPDWFRASTIRSHPPVPKYFFGAAVTVAGVPEPRSLELAEAYDRGLKPTAFPPHLAAEYLARRRPARIASFACNALSAVILFAVALRLMGTFAAVATQLLLVRHYLFASMLFYARSDTVQTVCATATIVPLLICALAVRTSRAVAAAMVAGTLAALAFQTRVNGGVALLMCIAFLVVHARNRRALLCIAAAIAAFGAVSIAINPFYWAQPRPAPDVPAVYYAEESLPLRIVHRFELQVLDLQALAAGVETEWHIRTLAERLRFASSVFVSGKVGLATLIGCFLVLAFWKRLTSTERAVLAWAATGILVMAFWIPLRWDPYLLIVLPAWVLAGAAGFHSLARASRSLLAPVDGRPERK